MIYDVMKFFKKLDNKDIRILTGIEVGMKHYKWVPLEEIVKYTKIPSDELFYRLDNLVKEDVVVGTRTPYEGYQIYFNGYDTLALNALVKRGSISAIGDEIGYGKESVVHEGIKEPELAIEEPISVVIKFHREGISSFKSVKRIRDHLVDREHYSWVYASRLSAKREYEVLANLYPDVSVPEPVDQNRNAVVMHFAKGSELTKTKLLEPDWFFDEIIQQIKNAYSLGIIHADLSEYNIFVNPEGVEIIDWPQYITLEHPHAAELLNRDVSNVLTYFNRKYKVNRDLDNIIEYIKNG
jgi:RIO kinase 2